MKAPWRLAVALGLAAAGALASEAVRAAGGPGGEGGTCELPRVDRARTPSTACMQCHDGSAGPAIPPEMAGHGTGRSHPVGMVYAAIADRDPERYAPAASLPRHVPLVDGRVECTTCHDGTLSLPAWVPEQPGLCLACHRF